MSRIGWISKNVNKSLYFDLDTVYERNPYISLMYVFILFEIWLVTPLPGQPQWCTKETPINVCTS